MSDNNNSFNFDFGDTYEDIISSSQKNEPVYEDIISDTSMANGVGQNTPVRGRYKKKKHGFWGKLTDWWKALTKGKKAALISVTSVFLVISLLVGWFFIYFDYNYNSITGDPDELGFSDVIDKDVINIALFGVDSRDETVFSGNTDSIMILSLNTKTKKVKIFSVMRDTFVPIENESRTYYGKINSVYATKNEEGVRKNPELAIKTLNKIFNLDISEYATVNFFGMTDIIDAVGGINATITEDELKWKGYDHPNLNNCMDEICNEMGLDASKYYIKSAGEQKLNGIQAVAYARVRNCTSVWGTRDDFGRTDRQRHVMQELFNQAVTMKKTQYISLIKALIPCSETSLSYSDVLSLAVNVLLGSPSFEQYRLPQTEFTMPFKGPSRYGSVVYYDLDYAADLMHGIIYDDMTMEQYIEQNPVQKNDWYSKMSAGDNTRPSTKPSNSNSSTSSTVTSEESKPSQPSTPSTPSEPEKPQQDECKHKNTETKNKKPATESQEGYTGDVYCKDCGELVTKGEEIERLESEPSSSDDQSKPTDESEPDNSSDDSSQSEPADSSEPSVPSDSSEDTPSEE